MSRRGSLRTGAAIDPAGPAIDVLGDADPWEDLWSSTSPLHAELSQARATAVRSSGPSPGGARARPRR
ncbi:hypothetical protein DZF98_14300 [Clavibacter californiensis]|uniref:Uncharacterized protein n=1 Tax=Clavibacter californiensis TaxID=1401995 RepID=A0ABX9N2D7_9MICO|nr:hypothetical protein DZF98_14300 [Clavibacter californiensis]